MKRLLFIAYFYPPLGGPGVQRPVKTIKYLKQFGWDIDVLTVGDIKFHSYDYKLLAESKADNIYRTRSLDLMYIAGRLTRKKYPSPTLNPQHHQSKLYFHTPEWLKKIIRGIFPIDDKIGWLPFAYRKALELIKEKKYDCIYATIGPYTAGVLAYKLHKKTHIPYFIDYRDHWTLHPYIRYSFGFLYKNAQKWERKILANASGISVIGNMMKQKMIATFGEYLTEKIVVAYNGFDEDDFQTIDNCQLSTIRYVGNLYGNRNADYFIKALEELKEARQLPDDVTFEFIGNYYAEWLNTLQSETLKSHIKIIPQVEHPQAVEAMCTSDLLLLFIATKDTDDFIVGKVFEYIRANVPILAMIPPAGEVAQILRKLGHRYICPMEDTACIKAYLREFFAGNVPENIEFDSTYSRENQTRVIIDLLDRMLKE